MTPKDIEACESAISALPYEITEPELRDLWQAALEYARQQQPKPVSLSDEEIISAYETVSGRPITLGRSRIIAFAHAIMDALQTKAQPAPDVAELVKAASEALEEIQSVMYEAYNNAGLVCCGRSGSECCGCPNTEWSEADEKTMDRFCKHENALRSALAKFKEQK